MKAPTIEEVRSYWTESKLHGDPEEFFDHFESNGWMVGRSPMKKWEAAARNWSRMEDKIRPWGYDPKKYPSRLEQEAFNKAVAGLSMDAYRQAFKQKFGVELREEKP